MRVNYRALSWWVYGLALSILVGVGIFCYTFEDITDLEECYRNRTTVAAVHRGEPDDDGVAVLELGFWGGVR